jgi:hypothetical protein
MNGEVQLIVTIPSTAPSGVVLATESGVIDTGLSPQAVFSYPNDMSAYVGGYVQMQSATYGDLGTFFISAVTLDNPAFSYISPTSTQLFSDAPWNFPNTDLPNFNYMAAVPSTTEKYLDLFENESISQNWKFQDLNNFTAQGAFSREFRVPFSAKNQLALGALFDVNVDSGEANYFHYKLPAEIRVDTLPIAIGYVRVRKIYKQQNRINEVELAFYAETPDLVRNIGEKKIADLTALSALDETANYDLVTNPSDERIWTLLDRGQLWSDGGEQGTRPLINTASPVYAADLTPAVSWWYLFQSIVEEAGFELAAGSLENILSNYWMPFCNTRYLQGTDIAGAQGFQLTTSANSVWTGIKPFDTFVYDNGGGYNTTTYEYTVPFTGLYSFSWDFNINQNSVGINGEVSYWVKLIINGVFTQFIDDNPFVVYGNTTFNWQLSGLVSLNVGDIVTFEGSMTQPLGTKTLLAGSSFTLNYALLSFGQTIIYSQNAPDMKQIDFLTDVVKMHNCAIVSDRAIPNKIYIVPQNSYLGSGDTLDWTSKLDTSKDSTLSSTVDLQKAKFQFTYTSGEDLISKVYRNVNRIYGDFQSIGYTVNPNTEPSDFAIGDQKIQLVTQSTPSGVINGSGYVMPLFYNDSLQFVAPGPRCLYEAGAVNVQMYDDTASTVVNTSVPVLNNYSQVYANLDDADLNWAPEVPAHPIATNPYNNLFNTYWRTYMNSLYSPESRILEASFALDLIDILTFKFSDKIWIQDSYWRILEITDYKVGDSESTKVKLLKFVEDVEDCSATPVSMTVGGIVNFEDQNGNPVDATQDCCTRYGYTWDEDGGVCWGNNNNVVPNRPTTGTPTAPATRISQIALQTRGIVNSVINGQNITIENNNLNMLAAGERLELTKDVGGSNLLGKNVTTNLPGMHVGGGYRDGDPTSIYDGWAQFGIFVLQNYPTITTSGQIENLDIEGLAGEYINMPDDTLWSVLMNVTIKDTTGVSETSLLHFTLEKIGGLSAASAITTISTIGAIGANVFTFGIDTTTNTDEHRINVTVTGGTYPDNFFITSSLQYQQSKTT